MKQPSQVVKFQSSDAILLEELVDKYTLHGLLMELVNICAEKSIHVVATWGDRELAKDWSSDAQTLDITVREIEN